VLYGLSGPILFFADFAALADFLPFVLDMSGSVNVTPLRKLAEPGSRFFWWVGSVGFTEGSIVFPPLLCVGATGTISLSLSPSSYRSLLALSSAALSTVYRSSISGVITSMCLIASA
jgi:hypothetical protein